MTQITKGFSNTSFVASEEEEMNDLKCSFSVTGAWLGNSCGIRYRTTDDPSPVINNGIVVYLSKKFEETSNEEQYIKHVQTKNGVLTICGSVKHG